MTTKPTSTLLRLLISIAITAGVQLVYAKPVPDNFQIDGFLQQQLQQQPDAGESFVVAYGGDNSPNYNLDSTDLNAAAQFGVSTPPTPTSQENPSPAEGDLVAWEGWENTRNNVLADDSTLPEVTGDPATQKARAEEFQNFNCGNEESVCCSGNHPAPAVSGGKHVCANSKFCSTHFFSCAVLANEFLCNAEQDYYAIASSLYNANLKIHKLPCLDPVYLHKCQDIQVKKQNLLP